MVPTPLLFTLSLWRSLQEMPFDLLVSGFSRMDVSFAAASALATKAPLAASFLYK